MKYTTNDLSKILDVSTNTIRRYEEKGFLNAVRNENNGYREFNSVDVEKLMYTRKYRRVGFSQEEILRVFDEDIHDRLLRFEQRQQEIEKQIAELQSIWHLLKDDSELIHRIEDFGDCIKPHNSCAMNYILYQVKGDINLGKEQTLALHMFLNKCLEYEYIYYFKREDVLDEAISYSEGVAINELMSDKFGLNTSAPVEYYPAADCIMRVVRVPLDLMGRELMNEAEIKETLFGQFKRYMTEHNQELASDVIGIKLGMSHEENQDWQYVLMHVPVKNIE